jgi:hypothetical protein
MGGFDAIVSTGFLAPGFEAERTISRIQAAGVLHASLLTASLIGKRTSIVIGTMPLALTVKLPPIRLDCDESYSTLLDEWEEKPTISNGFCSSLDFLG